nr:MAG TPA: DNA-damage-inducible protein J [Caudoviricetes sp.]
MMNSAIAKNRNKKLQVNINRELAGDAEDVIEELGLTPTAVINALYREIVATGRIPLNLTLTPEQRTELHIRQLSKDKPEVEIKTNKDLEEFFSDED